MSHFAEVDSTNTVLRVIVAEQDFIDSGAVGDPKNWIQTSYNTRNGQHTLGGVPFRGNYASAGFVYNAAIDAFLPPKPFASWVLDEATFSWKSPTPYPTNGKFSRQIRDGVVVRGEWNEETLEWMELIPPPVMP